MRRAGIELDIESAFRIMPRARCAWSSSRERFDRVPTGARDRGADRVRPAAVRRSLSWAFDVAFYDTTHPIVRFMNDSSTARENRIEAITSLKHLLRVGFG